MSVDDVLADYAAFTLVHHTLGVRPLLYWRRGRSYRKANRSLEVGQCWPALHSSTYLESMPMLWCSFRKRLTASGHEAARSLYDGAWRYELACVNPGATNRKCNQPCKSGLGTGGRG